MTSQSSARWTGRRSDDGHPVEFRLVPPTLRRRKSQRLLAPGLREMQLQLRHPPGSWQTISRVANADEAEYILDLFYEGLFSEIERS